MGLFDFFRKKPERGADPPAPAPAPKAEDRPELYLEIVDVISGHDEAALAEMRACLDDTPAYYEAHREHYEERSVDGAGDTALVRWLGMADILEARGHVCERDWKDEKPDFFYFLNSRSGMARLGLTLREDWLDDDAGIGAWCARIDQEWQSRQCCAAAIGTGGDCYVLFPCTEEELARLSGLAERLGNCIARASGM